MATEKNLVRLELRADKLFVPLVQGVVEQAARVFGLERDRALRLTMAAEEVVAHIATIAPDETVRLSVAPGRWCVRAGFSFAMDPSELWAMNLAARTDLSSAEGLNHLGLLLAARMNDAFSIRQEGGHVHLELRQDRRYAAVEPDAGARREARGSIRLVSDPEPALVSEACARTLGLYPVHLTHAEFCTPGKISDMLASGDLDGLIAMDEDDALCGMMLWTGGRGRAVGFYGPYVFCTDEAAARSLEGGMLERVARGQAVCLHSLLATPDLDERSFEALGSLGYAIEGERAGVDIWYRHLGEDLGRTVWSHPRLSPWLRERYEALVFMRTLREVGEAGTMPARSVFSCRLRPDLSEAVLLPLVAGADAAECVARHVEALHADGYRNLFFHLDLAHGWQAGLVPALLDGGFAPVIVLPGGGSADVVVFQHG